MQRLNFHTSLFLTMMIGGIAAAFVPANATSDLPDCKVDAGCLLELQKKWKSITVADLKTMIDDGAYIDAAGNWTPLHWSAATGHVEVIPLLVKAGVDVNAKGEGGLTPLHWSALTGQAEVIPLLVKAGADVNAKDQDGLTPLHWSALTGDVEVIPLLVKAGADVNAKDQDGLTPLHWSAATGDVEVISLLVKAGADVNAKGIGSLTPLDLAKEKKHWNAARVLEKLGGKCGEGC